MLLSIVIVLVLVVLNGFFATSELAIVSARRPRLETMAKAGSRGAARALKLAEDPTSFLSTVQIGITLIGIFAGAYSGATLAEPLAGALPRVPALTSTAGTLAFAISLVLAGLVAFVSGFIGASRAQRLSLPEATIGVLYLGLPVPIVLTLMERVPSLQLALGYRLREVTYVAGLLGRPEP